MHRKNITGILEEVPGKFLHELENFRDNKLEKKSEAIIG